MKTREMLELAALAAGVNVAGWAIDPSKGMILESWPDHEVLGFWAPHVDDGDSFRLAVALKMGVFVCDGVVIAEREMDSWEACGPLGDDPLAATRMAVLRCAAEVGKSIRAEGGAA